MAPSMILVEVRAVIATTHASMVVGQNRIVITVNRDKQRNYIWLVEEQTFGLQSGALITSRK